MAKAYVLMGCTLGREAEIIAALKSVDNVVEAHGTLGMYDLLAEVEADTEEVLTKTVTESIRKMEHIRSTVTCIRVAGGEYFARSSGAQAGKSNVQAYVVLHTEKGEELTVVRNLDKIAEVSKADVVFGYYDVICKVEAPSHEDLEKVITRAIRQLRFIVSSMTLQVVEGQG